ncbi:hypothetical protein U1Q18_036096 [Sarracenia purpurea var. burkii]
MPRGGFSWVAARLWRRVFLGVVLPGIFRRLGRLFGRFGWISLLRWGVLEFSVLFDLVLMRRVLLELFPFVVLGLEVYSWDLGSAACGLDVCSYGGFFAFKPCPSLLPIF